jgi:hypothetical protein
MISVVQLAVPETWGAFGSDDDLSGLLGEKTVVLGGNFLVDWNLFLTDGK